jgi:hypothetical protein
MVRITPQKGMKHDSIDEHSTQLLFFKPISTTMAPRKLNRNRLLVFPVNDSDEGDAGDVEMEDGAIAESVESLQFDSEADGRHKTIASNVEEQYVDDYACEHAVGEGVTEESLADEVNDDDYDTDDYRSDDWLFREDDADFDYNAVCI